MQGLDLYDKGRRMRLIRCKDVKPLRSLFSQRAPHSVRPFPPLINSRFCVNQRYNTASPWPHASKFLTFIIHISLISMQRANVTHLAAFIVPYKQRPRGHIVPPQSVYCRSPALCPEPRQRRSPAAAPTSGQSCRSRCGPLGRRTATLCGAGGIKQ